MTQTAREKIESRIRVLSHAVDALKNQQSGGYGMTVSVNPNAKVALATRMSGLESELLFLRDVQSSMVEESSS